MSDKTRVVCLECATVCGEGHGKDTFSHLVNCLKVEPDSLPRLREQAGREWGERGKRVIHLIDALERVDSAGAGVVS